MEDDNYVLSLVRYIHQNPVKAGIVKSPSDYKWSSYNCYLDKDNYFTTILQTDLILELFSKNRDIAKKEFIKYMNELNKDEFIDIIEKEESIDEEEAKRLFKTLVIERKIDNRMQIPDELIKEFKLTTRLSNRKIAEITKINKEKINKIIRHIQ